MKCKICGKELHAHHSIFLTEYDEPLCENCFLKGKFERCRECHTIIEAGKTYCDECEKRVFKRLINNYSTKVKTKFVNRKGDNKNNIGDRYYGMEMEFSNTHPAIAKVVFKDEYNNQIIYNKADSSLVNNGVEIVTVPMVENRLLDLIDRMDFEKFREEHINPERLSDNAGVHIHVSRNTISQFDIIKLSFLLNGIDSIPYKNIMYYLCGRIKNLNTNNVNDNYYRIGSASGKYLTDIDYVGSHNVAFNLNNTNTVEFRLFKGSANKDELKSYVEIVHNLIEFVEKNSIKNINIPNFITYLCINAKNSVLKSRLKNIYESRTDDTGYRENNFKIDNLLKFIERNSLQDKFKILETLLFTNPNYIDYSKPITLDEANDISRHYATYNENSRIRCIYNHLKNKLIEDILTSV